MKKAVEEFDTNKYKFKFDTFEMEKNFDSAMADPVFKKLVSHLDIPREKIIKYTSLLKRSASEYGNCLKCTNIMKCKNQIPGHCYIPKVDHNGIVFKYKRCKYQKTLDTKQKHQRNIYFFDVPVAIQNADFDDVYTTDKDRFDAIEWVHKFAASYKRSPHQKGLYLTGNFGCGKTYLVSAMLNELAKKDVKSAIVFWPDFLSNLKSSFNDDFKERFDRVKKAPILLIDDIGAENTTEWSRDEIFCPLVQYRMENMLPTFFTSNLTLEELEEHFMITKFKDDPIKARRVIERIKQLTTNMCMVSKNLRK